MQVGQAVRYAQLLDTYGNILTPKQRAIFTDYLCFDNTLSEIAQTHNTTRQAVKDIVDRTCARLDELENSLHFCEKWSCVLSDLRCLCDNVQNANTKQKIADIIKFMEV